ncbi:uncharacterized protein V2V93DRAFT_373930 [Kockiozyma suomiensis]|uniref:uncharacterized protein n=1 Tax=Kockiozyma suomiensis TaxID=1337062 RepID=UPI003342E9BB
MIMVVELCVALDNPSVFNTVLSLALAIGIVGSYVPQHLHIITRRSSRGLSPWYLLLGVTSGTCSLANVLLLSSDVLSCCRQLSAGKCMAASLGVIQIALQFTMFAIILLLFIRYFPRDPLLQLDRVRARQVFLISALHFAVTFLLALIAHSLHSHVVDFYAALLGVEATLLAAFQYVPQIYMTYTLKKAESLSIHTLAIQAPGGFLWALTLALREGTDWSSWLPYFLAAVLQSILLTMCILYEREGIIIDTSSAEYSDHANTFGQVLEHEQFTVSVFEEDPNSDTLLHDQQDYDNERLLRAS